MRCQDSTQNLLRRRMSRGAETRPPSAATTDGTDEEGRRAAQEARKPGREQAAAGGSKQSAVGSRQDTATLGDSASGICHPASSRQPPIGTRPFHTPHTGSLLFAFFRVFRGPTPPPDPPGQDSPRSAFVLHRPLVPRPSTPDPPEGCPRNTPTPVEATATRKRTEDGRQRERSGEEDHPRITRMARMKRGG